MKTFRGAFTARVICDHEDLKPCLVCIVPNFRPSPNYLPVWRLRDFYWKFAQEHRPLWPEYREYAEKRVEEFFDPMLS